MPNLVDGDDVKVEEMTHSPCLSSLNRSVQQVVAFCTIHMQCVLIKNYMSNDSLTVSSSYTAQ